MNLGVLNLVEKTAAGNYIDRKFCLIKCVVRRSLTNNAISTLDYFECMELFFQKLITQNALKHASARIWEAHDFNKTKKQSGHGNPDQYNIQPTSNDQLTLPPGKYTCVIAAPMWFWQGVGIKEIQHTKVKNCSL